MVDNFELPCSNDEDCNVNGEDFICGCNTNMCGLCMLSGRDIQARNLAEGKNQFHYLNTP